METKQSMKISDVIKPEGVILNLAVPSKERLLQVLSEKAAAALGIGEKDVLDALQGREQLGSTGIGGGVAIPHASVRKITGPFALLARLAKPIEFGSVDDAPVDIVCLVLVPSNGNAVSLQVLSSIARLLRSADAVAKIRSAQNNASAYSAFTEIDQHP